MNVLIEGNKIAKISKTALTPAAGATVIDAKGRTLMPGLIDAHTHIMFATVPQMAGAHQRHRLSQCRRCQGRQRHADARLHQYPRPGRAGVWPQERHRRRPGSRARESGRRALLSRRPAAMAIFACRTISRRIRATTRIPSVLARRQSPTTPIRCGSGRANNWRWEHRKSS